MAKGKGLPAFMMGKKDKGKKGKGAAMPPAAPAAGKGMAMPFMAGKKGKPAR